MPMFFEYEDGPRIEAPSWGDVEESLRGINPKGPSYFILTGNSGNYVQAAGARLKLTVEHPIQVKPRSRHYTVGNKSEPGKKVDINCTPGPILVNQNEVLDIEDAVKVFSSFYQSEQIPSEYQLREWPRKP